MKPEEILNTSALPGAEVKKAADKKAPGYYTISIPTKPYLKRYLQSLYGAPTIFDRDNYFGTTLTGYLERKFFTRQGAAMSYRHFDNFDSVLTISMPSWWLKQTHFATDIPDGNIIYINKHFEERFEEDLVKYCLRDAGDTNIKKALEKFCQLHNIKLDDEEDYDITYEALKQKHYRSKKKFEKIYCKSVTAKNHKMEVVKPASHIKEFIVKRISMRVPQALSFTA